MPDPYVDITAAADEHTATARQEHAAGTFAPLDVAVWRRNDLPGMFQVEFLLTCGGPTVRVTVDECDGVEFFHSWGRDRDRCCCTQADEEFWRELAAEFAAAEV